jgi:hypothetical protein
VLEREFWRSNRDTPSCWGFSRSWRRRVDIVSCIKFEVYVMCNDAVPATGGQGRGVGGARQDGADKEC